jgi:acyl-CoA dehydrogenase
MTAVKGGDGKVYIINGSDKWITNGIWSRLCTIAVRTGSHGLGGISLFVVPLLGRPGVSMRKLSTGGGSISGTTYVELDDVRAPVENFDWQGRNRYIVMKPNHEQPAIASGATRQAMSTALEHVVQKEAFSSSMSGVSGRGQFGEFW